MAVEKGVGFPITAVDQFSGAFDALKSKVTEAEGGFLRLRGVLGFLGGGVLGAFMQSTIEAMDHLNDLSKSTGLTVEMLSGLRVAAKQSGADLDGMAAAINKLSVNIGKTPERFRELGISAKDPLEAFKQLADIFSAIQDPQLRAALGAEALGKQWASAAPLLSEGGAKIGEMVEKGTQLSGVTAEATRQADEFNDKLVLLTGTGALANRMLASMLPLLNRLADDLISATTGSESLTSSFSPLLETGKAVTILFGNVAFVLRGVGVEIGGMAAQIAALASGDLGRAIEIGRMMKEDAQASREAFDAWEKSILGISGAATRASGAAKVLTDDEKRVGAGAAEAARAFLAKGAAAEKAAKATKDLGLADAHVTAEIKHRIEIQKILNKEFDEAFEAEERLRLAKEGSIRSFREGVEDMEFEVKLLGLSNAQREVAIRLHALEKAGIDLSASGTQELTNRIIAAVQAQEGYNEALQRTAMNASVWDEFSSRVADVATGIREWNDALRDFVKELLWLLAKKWTLELGANFTGSATLAQMAGSTGQGTLGGSLLNAGMSWAGSSIPGVAAGGEFASAAVGSFMGPAAPGSAAAMGQSVYAFMSNPVTLGVLAVVAVAVALRARQGGPKEGGSFIGSFDASGALTGTSSERLYTPSSGDSAAREWGTSAATAYFQTLQRFGGSSSGITFGFGYDQDPRGSADSRVTALVRGAGGQTLLNSTQSAGRDDEDFQRAIGLQTRRAILAALQASELPEAIAAILRPLDAVSASAEDIDKALTAAEKIAQILDALADLRMPGLDLEVLKGFQRAGEELETTFTRVAGLWTRYQDLFLTDAEKLGLAQGAVDEAFQALGIAVPSSMEEFKRLVDSLDLTTEAGRTAFETLMGVAPAFASVSNAARGMLADFDSIMGRLRGPAYTAGQNQAGLEAATRQFMAGNAWTTGMDWRYVAQQITTITREDFQAYSGANQALINQILGYTSDLQGAAEPVATFTNTMASASGAVDDYARSLEQARLSLRGWATDKLLGNMSALSSEDKYAFALQEYQRALGSGDIGYFRDSADALLGIGRDRFASGTEYTDLFNRVLTDAEALGGFSLGRDNGTPASIDQMRAELAAELRISNQKAAELQMQVRDLIATLRETSREQTTATRDAADQTARAVRGAVESVAR